MSKSKRTGKKGEQVRKLTAQDVYDMYPDRDGLACGEPDGASDKLYAQMAEDNEDVLFAFLLRKLCGRPLDDGLLALLDLECLISTMASSLRETLQVEQLRKAAKKTDIRDAEGEKKPPPGYVPKRDSGMLFRRESSTLLGYLLILHGEPFDAELGRISVTPAEAEEHNELLDKAMIAGLGTTCEIGQGAQFYVRERAEGELQVTTWLGTPVSTSCTGVKARGKGLRIEFTCGTRRFVGCGKLGEAVFFKRVA